MAYPNSIRISPHRVPCELFLVLPLPLRHIRPHALPFPSPPPSPSHASQSPTLSSLGLHRDIPTLGDGDRLSTYLHNLARLAAATTSSPTPSAPLFPEPASASKLVLSSHYVGGDLKRVPRDHVVYAVSRHLPRVDIHTRVSGRAGAAGQIVMYTTTDESWDGTSRGVSDEVATMTMSTSLEDDHDDGLARLSSILDDGDGGGGHHQGSDLGVRRAVVDGVSGAAGEDEDNDGEEMCRRDQLEVPRGAVVFDYGAVVFLGVSPIMERRILESLTDLVRKVATEERSERRGETEMETLEEKAGWTAAASNFETEDLSVDLRPEQGTLSVCL